MIDRNQIMTRIAGTEMAEAVEVGRWSTRDMIILIREVCASVAASDLLEGSIKVSTDEFRLEVMVRK